MTDDLQYWQEHYARTVGTPGNVVIIAMMSMAGFGVDETGTVHRKDDNLTPAQKAYQDKHGFLPPAALENNIPSDVRRAALKQKYKGTHLSDLFT